MGKSSTFPCLHFVALVDAIYHPGVGGLPCHPDCGGGKGLHSHLLGRGGGDPFLGLESDTLRVNTHALDIVRSNLHLIVFPSDEVVDEVAVLSLQKAKPCKRQT